MTVFPAKFCVGATPGYQAWCRICVGGHEAIHAGPLWFSEFLSLFSFCDSEAICIGPKEEETNGEQSIRLMALFALDSKYTKVQPSTYRKEISF